MQSVKYVSQSLEETEKVAFELLNNVISNKKKVGATVLFFDGDLGSGKTTFTKSLAKALGVKETVISPTFILQKKYQTSNTHFKNLIHIDAYRFEHPSEVKVLDLNKQIQDNESLFVIEWPSRLGDLIKPDITLTFTTIGETARKITWQ